MPNPECELCMVNGKLISSYSRLRTASAYFRLPTTLLIMHIFCWTPEVQPLLMPK